MPVSNARLAESLAEKAEAAEGVRQQALKRAARKAFLWTEEASELLATGRSLTQLYGVGPFVAEQINIGARDHTKGLKIAGGIDEAELLAQEAEIEAVNWGSRAANLKLTVLRSTGMNLNPRGEGDMDPEALSRLDLVLGSFHPALRLKDD